MFICDCLLPLCAPAPSSLYLSLSLSLSVFSHFLNSLCLSQCSLLTTALSLSPYLRLPLSPTFSLLLPPSLPLSPTSPPLSPSFPLSLSPSLSISVLPTSLSPLPLSHSPTPPLSLPHPSLSPPLLPLSPLHPFVSLPFSLTISFVSPSHCTPLTPSSFSSLSPVSTLPFSPHFPLLIRSLVCISHIFRLFLQSSLLCTYQLLPSLFEPSSNKYSLNKEQQYNILFHT